MTAHQATAAYIERLPLSNTDRAKVHDVALDMTEALLIKLIRLEVSALDRSDLFDAVVLTMGQMSLAARENAKRTAVVGEGD